MVSVVYKGRALPIGWLVFAGNKGHCSEARHLEVRVQVQPLIPTGATVIVLGDGEFDGVTWLQTLTDYGWLYVCRTAKNAILYEDEIRFSFAQWGVQRGQGLRVCLLACTESESASKLAKIKLPV
jgi:hypothetical protein